MKKIQELKRKALEARKAFHALLDQSSAIKTALSGLYEQQAQAGQTDEQRAKLAKDVDAKKAEAAELEARVTAARNAETAALEALQAEEEKLAAEDATLARQGAGGAGRRIELHDNREDKPWASFGEQMQAIVRAGSPGGSIDPRLFKAGPTGGNTTVGADGGFAVQTDYSSMLMEKAVESAQLLPLCDSVECSENSDRMEAPYIDETSRATGSRWGGVQVFRRAEADTVADKKPKIGKFELELEDIMGLAYLTGREIRDARVMEQVTVKAFQSEVAFKIDDEILNGTGVGMMTGILEADCLVEHAIVAGQGAKTIKTRNISDMWASMPARLKAGAIWIGNGEITPQLDELSIPAGAAALEPRFITYDAQGTLRIKGRPFVEIEQCSALGQVGDFMLVNMKEYLILTKGGLKTDVSIHARFVYDEQVIRFLVAINGKPKAKAAIAPYKGEKSKSAFVALAAR